MAKESANLRNLCFVGHPSAGKTTLVDALAHELGASERKGSVTDRTSICDTEPEEHERGHTLQLAVVHAEKDDVRWNLVDTPGYPEFVGDTAAGIFSAELTVGVASCTSGVTFNFHQKMQLASELGRGRAVVVTHVDSENVDFAALLEDLRSKIGETCVPVLPPDASGGGFGAVQSVLDGADAGWRKRLLDRVMDSCEDEELLMEYLENETVSDEVLRRYVPLAIASGALVPVLACNPATGLGIPELVSFVSEFCPSPVTRPAFRAGGEPVEPDPSADLLGVVVHVKSDPHVGRVSTVRVLRGVLRASDQLGRGKGEKPGGLFLLAGGRGRTAVDEVGPGEIAAITKVEGMGFGEPVVRAGADAPAVDLPSLPAPMVAVAVSPKSRSDEQKIGPALAKLMAEDPCLSSEQVALTHELVVHGMSDLHLQIMEARLKRRYGVEVETRTPRIAYRETVTKPSEGHHRHKKQTGGRGQFGECFVRMRPGEKDSGFVFVDEITGGAIPRNLIPAVEKGMREIAEQGVLTHSKVVDVEVALYDGKFHAVDSDEASFKKAGAWAFRDAFQKGGPVLLEPIAEVEIKVPAEDAGAIFSDLTSHRRGHVIDQGSEADGAITVIRAHVPIATMQTYHRDLKSITAGEGSFTMELHHYDPVPANEQQRILAEAGKKVEEE